MTLQVVAQLVMLATLILMITGKTPIYMTAITGAAVSAIVAGFPLAGGEGMTVTKMIVSGLNPVIADMTGILLFIGIMQATGFLDVIIRDIVRIGNKFGGGVGVGAAGGVAAAFAAASGASLIQYFLTGGPVAALATVIPVIPGSDLKGANAFQRPSILFGCLVAFIITACLNIM